MNFASVRTEHRSLFLFEFLLTKNLPVNRKLAPAITSVETSLFRHTKRTELKWKMLNILSEWVGRGGQRW